MAPSQGASTAYKIIKISYLQDCNASPCTNVQDAGIKQITYGYSTSGNTSVDNLVGTIDFSYATIPLGVRAMPTPISANSGSVTPTATPPPRSTFTVTAPIPIN